ncbi:hypothetical protein L226DRAFT_524300 [Lentinus tigrinus ALCF2SS1-7]|uniref:Uncharacterized protein n=1 Tax=Lentinus tigrinus ALCF2SS1-6 TaxID=1328759 RepID=A0A5C2S2U7_9APHY|nr:hypothetical protein L227DRAFT_565490 [Lentinus tigrinus ALCF2SS1-6]RPD73167.1 hypothetical protein L226DRAFT_524300 [Lentinus tigrinus ALCF2SS1-7]
MPQGSRRLMLGYADQPVQEQVIKRLNSAAHCDTLLPDDQVASRTVEDIEDEHEHGSCPSTMFQNANGWTSCPSWATLRTRRPCGRVPGHPGGDRRTRAWRTARAESGEDEIAVAVGQLSISEDEQAVPQANDASLKSLSLDCWISTPRNLLLELYITYMHPVLPIVHKPTFMDDWHSNHGTDSPYSGESVYSDAASSISSSHLGPPRRLFRIRWKGPVLVRYAHISGNPGFVMRSVFNVSREGGGANAECVYAAPDITDRLMFCRRLRRLKVVEDGLAVYLRLVLVDAGGGRQHEGDGVCPDVALCVQRASKVLQGPCDVLHGCNVDALVPSTVCEYADLQKLRHRRPFAIEPVSSGMFSMSSSSSICRVACLLLQLPCMKLFNVSGFERSCMAILRKADEKWTRVKGTAGGGKETKVGRRGSARRGEDEDKDDILCMLELDMHASPPVAS